MMATMLRLIVGKIQRHTLHVMCLAVAFLFGGLTWNLLFGAEEQSCEPLSEKYRYNSYFLVVLVLSAPRNFARRNAIRETWLSLRPRIINNSFYHAEVIRLPSHTNAAGMPYDSVEQQRRNLLKFREWMAKPAANVKVGDYRVKHYFAVGTRDLDAATRRALADEQALFHDLLLLPDLQDSYGNLTRKLQASLAAVARADNFDYLLKVDDDTYVRLDVLSQDLLNYDRLLLAMGWKAPIHHARSVELYWGYFNGRARVKAAGQWRETAFSLCDRYLPYALGGGYVLSAQLAEFVAKHHADLQTFVSEDVSMGVWLAPFANVYRRHDVRFDTAWTPRQCQPYHLVLHKREPDEMRALYRGEACVAEAKGDTKRPAEYFYDWTKPPGQCCDSVL